MTRPDCDDRSNSVAELAAQEELLRLKVQAAELGTFDYDPGRDRMVWDDKCRECFGILPGVPISYQSSFVPALHPDDRDETLASVSRIVSAKPPSVPFELRYRTVGISDGILRYIVARGRRMRMADDSERLLGVVIQMPDEAAATRFVIRGRSQEGAMSASRRRAASALVLARRWDKSGIRGVTITEPGGLPLRLDVFSERFFPGKDEPTE